MYAVVIVVITEAVLVAHYWQSQNAGIFSEVLVTGTEPDVPDVSEEEEEKVEEELAENEDQEDDVKVDDDEEVFCHFVAPIKSLA